MQLIINDMARIMLFLTSLFPLICANAQTSQIASLLHDGNITIFYSSYALIDAHEAAVDGDVITLSSGIFNAVDITKNITMRGVGAGFVGAGDNSFPTTVSGSFTINCPQSDTNHLTLEGMRFLGGTIKPLRADRLMIMKCGFDSELYGSDSNGEWNDWTLVHSEFQTLTPAQKSSLSMINCVVADQLETHNSSSSYPFSANITNSVVYFVNSISCCGITNSVIVVKNKSAYRTQINSSCSISHCVVAGCDTYSANNGGNKFWTGTAGLFISDTFYELSEEIASFTGTDGSQVGIRGGSMPFSPTLSIPRVSRFNVSTKTTADGKLSVDIKVDSAE